MPLASVCLWLLHTYPTGLRFHLEKNGTKWNEDWIGGRKIDLQNTLKEQWPRGTVCHNGSTTYSDLLFNAGMAQWWERSGESTRLPPMWPGFDSQIWRHMWVEFVGSLLCTVRFSPGTPVSPLLKNRHMTWFVLIVKMISAQHSSYI